MVGLNGLSEMNFDSCSHAYKFITTFSYIFCFISFVEEVSALPLLKDTVIPRYLRERGFRTCLRCQNMQITKAHSWFPTMCRWRSHGYRGCLYFCMSCISLIPSHLLKDFCSNCEFFSSVFQSFFVFWFCLWSLYTYLNKHKKDLKKKNRKT